MKYSTTFILFFLLIANVYAQQNLFPKNFPKTIGVKQVIVKRDCNTSDPKEQKKHIQTYYFDYKGYNISENGIEKGQKSGEQKYFWNPDGTLQYYQNWNTYSYSSTGSDNGSQWCKDSLTNEVHYLYQKGILLKIQWFEGNQKKLQSEVFYEYNNAGKLIKERLVDYPRNGFNMSFKPNSTELTEVTEFPSSNILEKKYTYKNDSIYIQYFNDGKLTGKGIKKTDSNGKTLVETTYDLDGKTIYRESNTYNSKGQITQSKLMETGYDGYGNAYDYTGADLINFEYDSSGNLMTKKNITKVNYG